MRFLNIIFFFVAVSNQWHIKRTEKNIILPIGKINGTAISPPNPRQDANRLTKFN